MTKNFVMPSMAYLAMWLLVSFVKYIYIYIYIYIDVEICVHFVATFLALSKRLWQNLIGWLVLNTYFLD